MNSNYPLEGIRILDFAQLIAGPSSTAMLAELGADVIKVESPTGDVSRKMGRARLQGFSSTFAAYNKGKRSLSIDLQTEEGRNIAKQLIASSDVIVEAFRPGVMERLGLGYEQVRETKPDIIYVSFSGFGEDGPMAERPGVDILIQGESGIMSITGEEDGQPLKIGFTAVDAAAGFALSNAIMAGVIGKLKTGQGRRLRMSLLDVALYMQAVPMTEYLMSGVEPGRTGNAAPLGSPAEVFKTRDGALIVSAYFANQWPDLCRILGLEDIAEHPDYATNDMRIENRKKLRPLLQDQLIQHTSQHWKDLFKSTRIIFGDVLSYSQVVENPQVLNNASLVSVNVAGEVLRTVAPPCRIDGFEPQSLSLAKRGEHNVEILKELGYMPDEIDALVSRGVVMS